MAPGAVHSEARAYLAHDAAGRELFVPWYPFSRVAWVVDAPSFRPVLARRLRRTLGFALSLVVLMPVVHVLAGPLPWWSGLVVVALLAVEWAIWVRRHTRGLERTRYEPPG